METNGKKIKIYIYWVIVFLYLALIFYFSSHDGQKSHEVSSGILQFISMFTLFLPDRVTDFLYRIYTNYEFLLRKGAHFTEYLFLYLIFFKAMITTRVKPKKTYIITLVFCFLYAISDEIHQIFVPGRAFAVTDILIDTLGASAGLGITAIFRKILKSKNR